MPKEPWTSRPECAAVRDQPVASDQTRVAWIGCICRCGSGFRGHRLDFQDATRLPSVLTPAARTCRTPDARKPDPVAETETCWK